mgnify:CR=1 FL=1
MFKEEIRLTEKELEVVKLICEGLVDKQIGNRLNIAYGTVRNHIDKAMLKYGAQNRAHLVAILKDLKII